MALVPHGPKGEMVKYSDLSFKHAPKWLEVAYYVTKLERLLTFSGGLQVNQKRFTNASLKHNAENSLGSEHMNLEKGIYALCAMISQLLTYS